MRLASLLVLFLLTSAASGVEHATITVDGSGVPTKVGGTANFFLDPGQVTGEYPVRIGTDASDDAAGGALINAVSQNDRDDKYSIGSTVRDDSPNSANTRDLTGGLALSSTKAGPALPPDAGTPLNSNLSSAYFPFSEGWQAGSLYSSVVNVDGTFGALDTLVASTGISLGTNVQPNFLGQPGVSKVTIPGVVDAARQGVLLATGAENVGRFPQVAPSLDGDGYIVRTIDNDAYFEFDPSLDPGPFGEGDAFDAPYSFVFVPVGTPGVTLARVATHGNTMVEGEQVGVPLVHSGANFTVTSNNQSAPGNFRLEISGFTPADGTLLVTPEGSTENQGGRNPDNVVTYQADATGWTILSQDLEADALYSGEGDPVELSGNGQFSDGAEGYFSFVFIPNSGAPSAPGAVPARETLTTFTNSSIIGWNTDIIPLSIDNNNNPASTAAVISGGGSQQTPGVKIDQFANRGDIAVAVDGEFINTRNGLLLVTINEGLRDNTPSDGVSEYGVGMTTAFNEQWGIATAAATNIPGEDEHNINYAAAFFGKDSGFQMTIAADIEGAFGDPYETSKLDVNLPGVNSLTDGVLIAAPHENGDNFASAEPKADGSGWEVRVFDNTHDAFVDNRIEPDLVNWIYLPYDTENLTAGLVEADGTIVSSSPGEGTDWTLVKEDDAFGFAQYRLSFTDTDKNPEAGMLLLVGTGDYDGTEDGTENQDNSLLYETDGNDFLIRGIDHVSDTQIGAFVDFQETAFMFAYIDFVNAPVAPVLGLPGDFNGDGIVDAADYTVWRDNFGAGDESALNGNGDGIAGVDGLDYILWKQNFGATLGFGASTASVPEPATAVIVLLVAVATVLCNRKR